MNVPSSTQLALHQMHYARARQIDRPAPSLRSTVQQLPAINQSHRDAAIVLHPRKQPIPHPAKLEKYAFPNAVIVTAQLLDALRGLSLPKAASTLGVSTTAFKRACRSLGIIRWGFTRGPARVARNSCRASHKNLNDSLINTSPETDSKYALPCGYDGWCSDGAEQIDKLWLLAEEPEADDALVLEMLSWKWPA